MGNLTKLISFTKFTIQKVAIYIEIGNIVSFSPYNNVTLPGL